MPRYHPAPAPSRRDIMGLPLHVLLRDWPELDAAVREGVPSLEEVGHLPLSEALGGDASLEALVQRMEAATSWRLPREP